MDKVYLVLSTEGGETEIVESINSGVTLMKPQRF